MWHSAGSECLPLGWLVPAVPFAGVFIGVGRLPGWGAANMLLAVVGVGAECTCIVSHLAQPHLLMARRLAVV